MKKKFLILFTVLVMSFSLLIGCSSTVDNDIEEPLEENDEPEENNESEEGEEEILYAPDFELDSIDGETYKLSDLRGQKVIINFWATWCPYCVDEMPDLTKLAADYSDDLVVLAVNVAESESKINSFLQENSEIDLNILLDPKGDVASVYGANSIPLTVGINSDGSIETGYKGMLTYTQMESLYNMLK